MHSVVIPGLGSRCFAVLASACLSLTPALRRLNSRVCPSIHIPAVTATTSLVTARSCVYLYSVMAFST